MGFNSEFKGLITNGLGVPTKRVHNVLISRQKSTRKSGNRKADNKFFENVAKCKDLGKILRN